MCISFIFQKPVAVMNGYDQQFAAVRAKAVTLFSDTGHVFVTEGLEVGEGTTVCSCNNMILQEFNPFRWHFTTINVT